MTEDEKNDLRAKVEGLLKGLGMSLELMIDKLREERCYGLPNNGRSCPIAAYLQKNGINAFVTANRIRIWKGLYDTEDLYVCHSRASEELVKKFDDGLIPELRIGHREMVLGE